MKNKRKAVNWKTFKVDLVFRIETLQNVNKTSHHTCTEILEKTIESSTVPRGTKNA